MADVVRRGFSTRISCGFDWNVGIVATSSAAAASITIARARAGSSSTAIFTSFRDSRRYRGVWYGPVDNAALHERVFCRRSFGIAIRAPTRAEALPLLSSSAEGMAP